MKVRVAEKRSTETKGLKKTFLKRGLPFSWSKKKTRKDLSKEGSTVLVVKEEEMEKVVEKRSTKAIEKTKGLKK